MFEPKFLSLLLYVFLQKIKLPLETSRSHKSTREIISGLLLANEFSTARFGVTRSLSRKFFKVAEHLEHVEKSERTRSCCTAPAVVQKRLPNYAPHLARGARAARVVTRDERERRHSTTRATLCGGARGEIDTPGRLSGAILFYLHVASTTLRNNYSPRWQ